MSKRLAMAGVVMLLVIGLAIPLATLADNQGGGQGTGQNVPVAKKGGHERHPEIREALAKLQGVKKELTTEAASDFGGHKHKAVEHIEAAISELHQALQADKN